MKTIIRFTSRNLWKNKISIGINALGLIVGIWSFAIILLYVQEEKSFDNFHEDSDRIYRLTSSSVDRGPISIVPYKWGDGLINEWAEAEQIASVQNITIALTIRQGENIYSQNGVVGVDSSFLKIFDFPVLVGDSQQLLKSPGKIVITPEMASKYFQKDNPIGKTLQINLWGKEVHFEIEGIVRCPNNSHLQFNFLVPMEAIKSNFFNKKAFDSWRLHFTYTYMKLRNPISDKEGRTRVKSELKNFLKRHLGTEVSALYEPNLQALRSIYLGPSIRSDFMPRGNHANVQILGFIAWGILLMSVINFLSISSSQALARLKQFGLQKILGSSKRLVVAQFVAESIFISTISTVLASGLVCLALPLFNRVTEKSLN